MMSKAQTQLITVTLVLFNALHLVAARGRGGGGGGGGSAATEEEPHDPPQSTNTQDCTQVSTTPSPLYYQGPNPRAN
ncbi:hypothetical protein FRC19_006097 [Serendipita sp. 401]|nr:hypothetical protein FRC19_006097 [Serendipita sp. 401]